MVAGLCPVFYLAQAAVRSPGGFAECLCEQIRIHEMGAGAGGEKAAVFHQSHAAQVDLPVSFDCVFDGVAGFGEGGWI